jgi:hypothetical protein
MIYARVHDQTVADDYYAAMQEVEKRLDLLGTQQEDVSAPISDDERGQLLELTKQLELPELKLETRLRIATQMREVLSGKEASPFGILTTPTLAFLEAVSV